MKGNGKQTLKSRHSLKRQMALIFILLTGLTIIACWVFNVFFLEKYYLEYKKANLKEIYVELDRAREEELFDDRETETNIMHLCNTYNANFVVTDASSNAIYANINDPGLISRQLRDIVFSRNKDDVELIEESDDYTLSYLKDPMSKADYLTMWGNLDEDSFFMIRTAVDSVKDSVRLSNHMLGYAGIVALLLAGVLIWYVAKRITDPIMSLVDVSQHMKELDFERRYTGNSRNEIGVLGENINQLSATLEETISHLKTANLELQRDVEARRNAEQRRQEFLGNVSHELKTPIALIQGYAEGLKDGISEDQESRDYYCDVIMDETHKMNHLVKRLISLNQVESGEDIMMMERFDLNELIVSCIASFEQMFKQKGISMYYEEKPGLYVWGDEYQVEEVLRNYISNAANHCKGKMEIVVKAELLDGHVRTGVYNSGEPIPEESVDRLWDKFYKVDKARTREYGGSGLGLSIVKAIMGSLHQQYGVINYDDGVEFWFELETK